MPTYSQVYMCPEWGIMGCLLFSERYSSFIKVTSYINFYSVLYIVKKSLVIFEVSTLPILLHICVGNLHPTMVTWTHMSSPPQIWPCVHEFSQLCLHKSVYQEQWVGSRLAAREFYSARRRGQSYSRRWRSVWNAWEVMLGAAGRSRNL